MTHDQFEVLSNQAVAACAVVYFLAVLAHLAQWAAGRTIADPATVAEPVAVGVGSPGKSVGHSDAGLQAAASPRTRCACPGATCTSSP